MVRLKPSLQNIKGFGTEGELNVYNVMKASFPTVDHPLCFIRGEDNT